MAKSWGDVFNAAKRRGDDPSYAAFLADEWEKRKKPMYAEKRIDRLDKKLDRYRAALERIESLHQRNIPGFQCRCDACSIAREALFPIK